MIFTLLSALAACQSTAMRPELSLKVAHARMSQKIASLEDRVSKISSPKESMATLQEAAGLVDGILAEAGNATEHMSDDDAALLRSVIELVETTIYGSMDSAHTAQVKELNDAKAAVDQCNVDITARQASDGDLGLLHEHVSDKQKELNRLQGVVDEETLANATAWETFNQHMQMLASPPACPDFPARTMPALDVYFETSAYSIWYAAQQEAYNTARDKYVDADRDLQAAIAAYDIQKAIRDTQYCDWKGELEAACAQFDACFLATSAALGKLKLTVTDDMNQRIEVLKAGDTLIQQIKFLLAESKTRETPQSDVSRYTIAFPLLSVKANCDLTVLDDEKWIPTVSCNKDACFEDDVGLPGNDLRVVNVPSSLACQKSCRKEAGCKWFTWWAVDGRCFLKDSDEGRRGRPGALSGPAFCAGDIVWKLGGPGENCDQTCSANGESCAGNQEWTGWPGSAAEITRVAKKAGLTCTSTAERCDMGEAPLYFSDGRCYFCQRGSWREDYMPRCRNRWGDRTRLCPCKQ